MGHHNKSMAKIVGHVDPNGILRDNNGRPLNACAARELAKRRKVPAKKMPEVIARLVMAWGN